MKQLILLASILVISASPIVQAVPWTCYDYSLNWTEQNPDWGYVVISNNPRFHGLNHMVNYKIIDNETLLIHDAMNDKEYQIGGWRSDHYTFDYYHFYLNGEQPTRHYKYLLPNAEKTYLLVTNTT